ncbi:tetratricopeptide repeat protein [Saccharopolyspora sp. NFXS83]|uniref:AfsR/SARP family transcriptional regulator n=1 Tax=Saccharopolyspora sp. NFXS83 TaxID=2993560 RepID=UPI00224B9C97|nr:tetratricopeptide repeat protein [Saccharopolyspora sp. NFXS83]MCX2731477.1 tetratricopeptide repeat protein [Saccharopolyspora sp. NFXS83]
MTLVDFMICGNVSVRSGDDWPEQWAHKKTRHVLGVLLTRPRMTFPINDIVDWVWGDEATRTDNTKIIQGPISKARSAIANLDPAPRIQRVAAGYRIDVDKDRIDLHYAKTLVDRGREQARKHRFEQACQILGEAFELLREDPLADLQTAPAIGFRRSVRDRVVLPAIFALTESQIRLGEPWAALNLLDSVAHDHPLDLRLAERRFEATLALGDEEGAADLHLKLHQTLRGMGLQEEADQLRCSVDRARAKFIPAQRTPAHDVVDQAVAPPPPRRLPHHRKQLTDRERLLNEIDVRTEHGNAASVVVLTGAAGVGKTALAQHWANRHQHEFSGGAVFFDLQGFSNDVPLDSDELIRLLLSAFGHRADLIPNSEDRVTRLGSVLQGKRTLLLLDNVREAEQVRRVLEIAPDALILITSRSQLTRLTLRHGAIEIEVGAVAEAETARWLYQTIGTRCAREPDSFDELVRLCVGIPLFFNLIGHYAVSRPRVALSEIAAFLHEEQRLLNFGTAKASDGISIKAVFTMSYQALSEDGRRMFRLLGLHPHPRFTVELAEALLGLPRAAALDQLEELQDLHLISQHNGYFQMLNLTHLFAAERAHEEEYDEVDRELARARMLGHYVGSASNAEKVLFPYRDRMPHSISLTSCSPVEFSDEQQAFGWYMQYHSYLTSAVNHALQHGYHQHSYFLANIANEPLQRLGRHRDALRCLSWGLASAQKADSEGWTTDTMHSIGVLCIEMGLPEKAEAYLSATVSTSERLGNHENTAIALHNLACARSKVGNLAAAEELFDRSLATARRNDLERCIPGTLLGIGRMRREQDRDAEAAELFHRALDRHEQLGNIQGAGQALNELGELALHRGELRTAIDYADRAATKNTAVHDFKSVADSCRILAAAHQNLGLHEQASEFAREGIRKCWEVGAIKEEAAILDVLPASLDALKNAAGAAEGRERASLLRGTGIAPTSSNRN